MKYDDASWHSGGEGFPDTSPDEFGGTHIALFLKWSFIQGWASDFHLLEEPEDVQSVISGELLASDFFYKYCDGKLTKEDFNATGNAFAEKYYGGNGLFFKDYADHFYEKVYRASESEHDFSKFSTVLTKRYQSNKFEETVWWKFWLR